ncbi:hypothetical protein SEPL_329 [Salmonella phage SE_PL]|uniref:hypothetical protein n=1 Tax=Salmonella enterica TaxID=28901 RepID=UPI000FDF97E7|nr:hypothetical protein CPT_Munch_094 [Salmonella phage Munch]EAZ2022890.1 hypothetical protein [Salmonella enterica]ECV9084024.1 hypothetical protein [Salmonella enterica subsp. enterica serovar Infantis]QCW18772.1 hypothetical protein 7t3_0251 [Salmonella phage 7t3]QIG62942.1 hypothetical protein SEPL_329 [Salmonella phage SE_PL]
MFSTNTFMRYHRMGFSPRPVRGKGPDQDLAVSYYFDNVQYVFNDYGEYEETGNIEDMNMAVLNLEYIMNSDRHDKIKKIVEFIQRQMRVPIWAEVAVDTQLGISFGCSEGMIAQLIMDFPTKEKFEEYKGKLLEQLKNLGADLDNLPPIEDVEEFILIPCEDKYDVLFKDMKIDGVVVEIIDDDDLFIEIDMDDDGDDDDDEDD